MKLFAERGVDGVSIRAINAEADRALAAVHYHFGSRESLIRAVLDWGGKQVELRTIALADTLQRQPGPPTARQIVGLLGQSYSELLEREPIRGPRWLNVVEQLSETHSEEYLRAGEASTRLLRLLSEAYPDASLQDIALWFRVAAQVLLVVLARMPTRQQVAHSAGGSLSEELVDFVAGGLDYALTGGPNQAMVAAGNPA